MTKISIIIPCYNSEKMISSVVEETIHYLDQLAGYTYEFVLVNDFSSDRTIDSIRALAGRYPFVKGIDLAKNCGQHNALLVGMRNAQGDLFMGMDDDMQTHPSQIKKLLNKLNEGYDIVYGHYAKKNASWFKRLGSNFNNYTVARMLGKSKEMKISSFWLVRRFVRDEAIKSHSGFSNLQGLFLRSSRRMTNVLIDHHERISGSSGYTLKKMFKLWSSILNYSILPLRLPFILSLGLLLISLLHLVMLAIFAKTWSMGFNLVAVLTEFLFSLLFLCIGLASEYIGRMFLVITEEPQYVVREYINFDDKKENKL